MKLISAEREERRDTACTGRPFPQKQSAERERESPDAFHPRQPRVITQEDELWIARKRKAIYKTQTRKENPALLPTPSCWCRGKKQAAGSKRRFLEQNARKEAEKNVVFFYRGALALAFFLFAFSSMAARGKSFGQMLL